MKGARGAGRGPYRKYNAATLDAAVDAFDNGGNIHNIAQASNVPAATISRHASAQSKGVAINNVGRPRTLSDDEERALTDWVKWHYESRLPCTSLALRMKARDIAVSAGKAFQTHDGIPSKRWLKSFQKVL
jgi:hypothetical protein